MHGSLNRVTLIGRLGADPEIHSLDTESKFATFSVATNERWNGKDGEKKEKTDWHKVIIYSELLVGVAEKYLNKGSLVYLEGKLESRQWEDNEGGKHSATEIVLRPYSGELKMLDSAPARPQAAARPVPQRKPAA
jgi:single-strand DNA-binding protein